MKIRAGFFPVEIRVNVNMTRLISDLPSGKSDLT
jgi:hypothetical protein